MNRRRWIGLGLGAGVAVAAGGAGWFARQRQAPVTPAAAPGSATAASTAGTPGDDPWALRFERPDGGTLVLAELRSRPLLINFWATWCPPCVKEMPMLDTFAREQAARGGAGWQVIGLAVDSPVPVREFLKKTPVSFPIGLAGFSGTELARQMGNTTGGLPYTVVLDPQGRVLHHKLGETDLKELRAWATTTQVSNCEDRHRLEPKSA